MSVLRNWIWAQALSAILFIDAFTIPLGDWRNMHFMLKLTVLCEGFFFIYVLKKKVKDLKSMLSSLMFHCYYN